MKKILNSITNNLVTRLDEIATKDIFSRIKRTKKVENSGFRLLPSANSFEITLSQINPLLRSVGIERRLPNDIKASPHTNKAMNRYAIYMIRRLEKMKSNPECYWRVAIWLMRNSRVFRTMAFNHSFKNWYKEMPLSFVKNICRKVGRIIKEEISNIDFKRTFIPKKEEDLVNYLANLKKGVTNIKEMKDVNFRPLGVPSHAWRVVLHMHANFLTLFLRDYISSSQHAYIPGRGTTTAWMDVLNKVEKYKYIYEIDLKQCFPNIQGEWITKGLKDLGVPMDYVVYIESLNRSTPTNTDEPDEINKRDENLTVMEKVEKYIDSLPEEEFEKIDWDNLQPLFNKVVGQTSNIRTKGLPQGANTSPILTELVLDHWIKAMQRVNNAEVVFYADDGLFFSNEEIVLVNDEARGIYIHPEKSGYIKSEGKWLKELKFLGIIYNGEKKTLISDTRKGKTLDLTDKMEDIFELLKILKPKYEWDWGSLFKFTSLGGLITNKLYAGTWDKPHYPEKVTLQGVMKSWLKKTGSLDNFQTTSSDANCFLAEGIMGKWDHVPRIKPVLEKMHSESLKGESATRNVKSRKWFMWKK